MPLRARTALSAAFGLLAVAATTRGDEGFTRRENARTVEVTSSVAPVRAVPEAEGPLLGTLSGGTRLEFVDTVPGEGCRGVFVRLAAGGFVCSRHLAWSTREPYGVAQPRLRPDALLPHRYVSTRRSGTPAYGSPEDHSAGVVRETYGRSFAFVSHGRHEAAGVRFERLARGTFVLADDVDTMRPSRFAGVMLREGEALDHAFALDRHTPVFDAPGGTRVRELDRHAVVHVAARTDGHARLTDGTFVALEALRIAEASARPAGVGPDETWIDVSIATQVLVAYRGDRPVFVTQVSTGADRAGRRTPLGEFRIGAKHAETTMDDLSNDDASEDYLVESVPWVQFFREGVAFHAAFWHDDFGRRRSHGCVNLSPIDARTLFGMTEPSVAPGFTSRYSTEASPGTLVRVR